MNHIPCAFVNGQPIRYGNTLGYKVTETNPETRELSLSIVRETFYEHPEAPNDAILSVPESYTVYRAVPSDRHYGSLMIMFHAQNTVSQIGTTT